MRADDLLHLIERPQLYEAEIERLRRKNEEGGKLYLLSQDGLSLAAMATHAASLAKVLARTVARGEYVFAPAAERMARISGKMRSLFHMRLTDAVVAGAVSRVVGGLVTPYLSPGCYSYQKGKSSWLAVNDLARFLDEHRRARPDVRGRGLYVIKRDISAYGDSIPVTDGSRLWALFEDALAAKAGVPAGHLIFGLIRQLARPEIVTLDGRRLRFDKGVPTGSPIQPITNNLYLTPLDRGLHEREGGFYARYGDDFVFAHPDADVAKDAARFVDETAADLELAIKDEKKVNSYFTGPGRPSEVWPETRSTSRVEYLGCCIEFGGRINIKRDKARRLLRDIRVRSRAARRLLPPDAEVRAATLCAVAGRVLDPLDGLAHPLAGFLRHTVNDRRQLKHLDFLIALTVAETLSGIRGVKAFRKHRYRALRRRWRLPSLVVARNAMGRRKRSKQGAGG